MEKAARAAFETQSQLESDLEASMDREEALCTQVESLSIGLESGKAEREHLLGESKQARDEAEATGRRFNQEIGSMAAQIASLSATVEEQGGLIAAGEARSRHTILRLGLKKVVFAIRSALHGGLVRAVGAWRHRVVQSRYKDATEEEVGRLKALQEAQKLRYVHIW